MSMLLPNSRTLNGPSAELLPIPRTVLDLMAPFGGKPRHMVAMPDDHQDELLDILATHHHAAHEHNVLAASRRPQNQAAVAQLREKVGALAQQAKAVTQKVVVAQEPQTPGQPGPVQQLIDNHPRVDNPQQAGYENQRLQTAGRTTGITTQFRPISLPCAVVPHAPASPYRIYTRANQSTRQLVPCANYPCTTNGTVGFAGSLSIPLGVIPMPAPAPPTPTETANEIRGVMAARTQPSSADEVLQTVGRAADDRWRNTARQMIASTRPGDQWWRYHRDCGGAPLCGDGGFILVRNGQYVGHLREWVS